MTGRQTGARRGTSLPLLSRMQRDLREHGSLRLGTASVMYAVYAGHAAATVASLSGRWAAVPVPHRAAAAGLGLSAGGAGLCVLGMRRFAGPGQVSGTRAGPLVTGGVYRWSRNPQYLGYVAALTGLALARRSGAGLLLAAAAGASYAAWVPVEEEHLDRVLGPAYEAYRSRTPRWLGRPAPRSTE